jgi:hypothetical protein
MAWSVASEERKRGSSTVIPANALAIYARRPQGAVDDCCCHPRAATGWRTEQRQAMHDPGYNLFSAEERCTAGKLVYLSAARLFPSLLMRRLMRPHTSRLSSSAMRQSTRPLRSLPCPALVKACWPPRRPVIRGAKVPTKRCCLLVPGSTCSLSRVSAAIRVAPSSVRG